MPREAAEPEAAVRWRVDEVTRIYRQPLLKLIEQAHEVHRAAHPEPEVQLCHLLSIKTGGCPEDCSYCPQSARYDTGVEAGKLMDTDSVLTAAQRAKDAGSTRFCMGAAWRQVKPGPEFDRVLGMVRGVSAMGLEVCCTLGMVNAEQAQQLAEAGLTAYNHNLDTSREFYGEIITTRTYQDRLQTIENVRQAGISVCCGGILGLGEGEGDRIRLLATLANLNPPPESVPINALVAVEGTPLGNQTPVGAFEFVRAIATARILMPESKVRLSAGRMSLSDEAQALAFYAGANSIFVGEKLLTTPNPAFDHDHGLLRELGLEPEPPQAPRPAPAPAPEARRRSLRERRGEDVCSNDYLGLSEHPAVREAMARALADGIAVGSTGSRLVRGNHPAFAALEERFAAWRGVEAGLLYSSGYAAGVGVLTALLAPGDVVVSDALNHASLIDGLRLAGARRVVVPHLDLEALATAVRAHRAKWVVTESLFSMDGDVAPLEAIAAVCERAGARLIVDEAHATGVFGPRGAGFAAGGSERLRAVLAATLHPCGKALGASGALVGAARATVDRLVNHSRSFIYSTAPSPLLAVQLGAAIALVEREPERRERVQNLAQALRAALRAAGVAPLGAEPSPVVPVVLGSDEAALAAERALEAAGFGARAIRPPTVAEGAARLRLTARAGHDPEWYPRLAAALAGARVG